jgi:hypothetical protein
MLGINLEAGLVILQILFSVSTVPSINVTGTETNRASLSTVLGRSYGCHITLLVALSFEQRYRSVVSEHY